MAELFWKSHYDFVGLRFSSCAEEKCSWIIFESILNALIFSAKYDKQTGHGFNAPREQVISMIIFASSLHTYQPLGSEYSFEPMLKHTFYYAKICEKRTILTS